MGPAPQINLPVFAGEKKKLSYMSPNPNSPTSLSGVADGNGCHRIGVIQRTIRLTRSSARWASRLVLKSSLVPRIVLRFLRRTSPSGRTAARELFKTFLWILGECGMRPAEVCGLDARGCAPSRWSG